MAVHGAEATWNGTLKEGSGTMKLGSGLFEGPFTYTSRFEDGKGTNPEELVGAAQAGCFSMFLASLLSNNGFPPDNIFTTARVYLSAGPTISKIELVTRATVPNISAADFDKYAAEAKAKCPVSKALTGVGEVTLDAALE